MTRHLPPRFWLEVSLALISSCLVAATLVWHDWLEFIFGVDPDAHSGTLEWAIVLTLLLLAVTTCVLARQDWRKVVAARTNHAGNN